MKGVIMILTGLFVVLLSSSAMAQNQQLPGVELTRALTEQKTIIKTNKPSAPKGDDETTVYWSEDFSNGFDGMDDNGTWTTDEDQGDLWFITYPVGADGGYNQFLALPDASDLYGSQIPNYFGIPGESERDVCASPSRDNGVVMIDGDRYNSTSTEEEPEGSLTQTPFLASLISPAFDLTGVEYAVLTWHHYARLCCSAMSLSVDFSTDNGETWVPYSIIPNEDDDIQVSLEISDVLQNAENLSECRVRFFWNGGQSHYFWSIDDININSLPDNDLQAGETWYNNHFELLEGLEADESTVTSAEYYDGFEYLLTPDYYTRPLKFAMVVTNAGSQIQTGVELKVTGTAPDGTVYMWPLDGNGISLEAGVTDTITVSDKMLTDIAGDLQYGTYTFDYEIVNNEEDQNPEDNVGATSGTNVSTELDDDDYAVYWNGANSYGGAYIQYGQGVIMGSNYVFPYEVENNYITHIETVFLYAEDFAETVVGESVYFNVRSGSLLDENDQDPETMTTVFFESDTPLNYESNDLEFTIEEEDIWTTADGFPMIWVSFELPVPILIEPDHVYQAEYRVPAADGNIVYSPVHVGDQEQYSSFAFNQEAAMWTTLTKNAIPIRFRTVTLSGLDDVSYERGITLIQNYPNPFNNVTRIQYSLDETQEASLEIRNIAGKLVYAEDLGMVSANAANSYMLEKGSLSAGAYTYSIATVTSRLTRKLIIE